MLTIRHRPQSNLILAAILSVVVIAIGSQLLATTHADGMPSGFAEPLLNDGPAGAADGVGAPDPAVELARIRADVAFWADRLAVDPHDVVSAVKLADASITEARATGDVSAYVRAEAATTAALAEQPAYRPAQTSRAVVLVALHRFPEARTLARELLAADAFDPAALGVLGDASLELGDLATAREAYQTLSVIADTAAAHIRRSRLAFIEGDTTVAVAEAQEAVTSAVADGQEGSDLAFQYTALGDLKAATGDGEGARIAYEQAATARPGWPAALAGIGRLDAGEGDLDSAISAFDQAIAAVPLPDSLARRAALLELRGAAGDADRAADDLATVEAIAALAGNAAAVHDRSLALFLADRGQDVERAVRLAENELTVRRDVYGYDTYAWALLAAGRTADARTAIDQALAVGTRDARLLYHAGMIALAQGRTDDARSFLTDALALEPGFDPLGASRARAALESLG
jgi:tetratricopeptide (TPR) repeat protein